MRSSYEWVVKGIFVTRDRPFLFPMKCECFHSRREHIFLKCSLLFCVKSEMSMSYFFREYPIHFMRRAPKGIMVVVFSVAKSSICFVEYNSHDALQGHLIEGIGLCERAFLFSVTPPLLYHPHASCIIAFL